MAEESRGSSREFQLETRHLAGIIVLIALLCVTSFMLGRWVERQTTRSSAADVLGKATPEELSVEDVNRELTYYRTLGGDESPPDVDRPRPVAEQSAAVLEARESATGPGVEELTPGAGAGDGILIQVMATRDLSSAIAMRQRLSQKGYSVAITEGSGATDRGLQKVRVGPYRTRDEAERAARRLEAEEGVRTWIP